MNRRATSSIFAFQSCKLTSMRTILLLFMVLGFVACKHEHVEPSAELKKAYAIQQEALEINESIVESTLSDSLEQVRKEWVASMIEIPGMDHDHSKCNGHHHERSQISVSDEEMIKVQTEWRDRIVQLKNSIK